jgi:alpha-tubulin suppressor-like RCC1 family protein
MIPIAFTLIRLIRRLAPVASPALLVTVVGCEGTESPTAPQPEATLDVRPAAALSFRQVSVGFFHTCGVTTGNVAYCWGGNDEGQLGDGTTNDSPTPVPAAGGLFFRHVTAGDLHTCGLALNDLTYCWGDNTAGQLGDGTTTRRLTPTRVHASGLRFRRVTGGASHNCGETADNRAYCWGTNFTGQLGAGTTTGPEICNDLPCSTRPIAVTGGRRFSQVNAGRLHTCGLTPLNVAFCWGDNRGGQLGNGTAAGPEQCRFAPCSTTPVRVVGGLQFNQIDGGTFHTCAVTSNNVAYCWGQNEAGRLGNGTFNQSSLTPSKVRGGIHFRVVSAGGFSTCGITPENVAYCWGYGGTLGDGTTTRQPKPVPVVGGLHFRRVDVGPVFTTCAVSTETLAYCWGIEPVAVPDPT